MIPKDKEYRLIKIYMYICDMYEQSLAAVEKVDTGG